MADPNNVSTYFNNLPMDTLISAPLLAVAESNKALAGATFEFINNVWIDPQKKTTRVLEFGLERPIDAGGGSVKPQGITVKAPFAALAQLPNLMVKTVDIEFTMEVKDSVGRKSETAEKVDSTAEAGFGPMSMSVTGSVSASSSNTRQTDQSAKYDVRVHAEQAPPTEGINKLAQIFAACIEPYKSSTTK